MLTINLKRLYYYLALVFLTALIIFCFFYLAKSYDGLRFWYKGLSVCFYKSDDWDHTFFTREVNSTGRIFCATGLIISSVLTVGIIRKLSKRAATYLRFTVCFTKKDLWLLIALLLAGCGLWWYGNISFSAGSDEIFSAVNCADLPPFQTWSYYMLPNNHILFNVLNGTFFSWLPDKVASGRIISLLAFLSTISIIFYWFKNRISNSFVLVASVLLLALQFTTWGFSFQARGYALSLLMTLLAFTCILKFINEREVKNEYLVIYAVANIIGMCIIPSFLYFYLATVGFVLYTQISNKSILKKFYQYNGYVIAFLFLFYLPAFCFSGIQAFSGNKYVKPEKTNSILFIKDIWGAFGYYLDICFSRTNIPFTSLKYFIFFIPLALLYSMKKSTFLLGMFYLIMWGTVFFMVLLMKRNPFPRNLNGQFSITLALVIYTLWLFVLKLGSFLKEKWRLAFILKPLYGAILCLVCLYFFRKNMEMFNYHLYGSDINNENALALKKINYIPKNATVYTSDESFRWYYQFRKMGHDVNKCPNGNELYYIKQIREESGNNLMKQYELIDSADDQQIWKRRK